MVFLGEPVSCCSAGSLALGTALALTGLSFLKAYFRPEFLKPSLVTSGMETDPSKYPSSLESRWGLQNLVQINTVRDPSSSGKLTSALWPQCPLDTC